VCGGVGGEDKAFAVRAGELDAITGREVAEIVGADAQEELVGVPVFVDGAFDGGGEDVGLAVFAAGGAGDGVEAELVWLAGGVDARRDDAEGLAGSP
jgi:hypothetical protein